MTVLAKAAAFVYDFLADDGWELLFGLAVILPLTYVLHERLSAWSGVLMLAAVLATVAISLARMAGSAEASDSRRAASDGDPARERR